MSHCALMHHKTTSQNVFSEDLLFTVVQVQGDIKVKQSELMWTKLE